MAATAAISVAQRSFRCCLWRTTGFSPSLESNKTSILKRFRHSPISSRFRRESYFLNSMLPIHTAIASTRLVSKLPSESNMSAEGRFANYLSPI
ncbi:uncharacterized protein LOC131217691 isoform X2 [Magnolia sinica]|uniref:uncharacterized protein LOC131217691 isoform X2 n=1 Tax=Magnolia sinica TaxID=86752 RepID=UPI002658ED64|nr:uncharacterized protein LOC131217691 isoform X2 [Magnolia sinica]